jgi:entericidin B
MPKIVFVILALVGLGACNTIEGAGQDISTAGQAVTDEAQEAQ